MNPHGQHKNVYIPLWRNLSIELDKCYSDLGMVHKIFYKTENIIY